MEQGGHKPTPPALCVHEKAKGPLAIGCGVDPAPLHRDEGPADPDLAGWRLGQIEHAISIAQEWGALFSLAPEVERAYSSRCYREESRLDRDDRVRSALTDVMAIS